jgi:hypothetical protein
MAKIFGVHSKGAFITETPHTPTFNGFGTPTAVQIHTARVGACLHIRGRFSSGTATAAEARMSLPAGLTSADTSKIPSLQVAGFVGLGATGVPAPFAMLIEPSVTYVTFGIQDNTRGILTKQNGNAIANPGDTFSFHAIIPIQGWEGDDILRLSDNSKI